jgi:hypothetical protein
MIGLLAVPVGVLLLVVVLALIGGRWTVPGAYAGPEPLEDYDEPFVDPWRADPWRLAEPPRPALPPAPRPALPPAPRPALPPASRLALPPAPPPRPQPQAPSRELAPAPRPYHRPPPPPRPAYGALSHERYDRPAEPDPESSSQQGFPYGPYRHQ